MQLQRNFVIFFLSLIYGAWVFNVAEYWSFDYYALIDSVEFYRISGFEGFFELLFNNTVLLVLWDIFFGNFPPKTAIDLLYGFAAFLRFYVFFTKFKSRLTAPIFLSGAVQLDLNQCRYSLAISLVLILLPHIKKYFLMALVFPLHLLAPAWALLLSPSTGKFLLLVGVSLFLVIAPDYFTRHFSNAEEVLPRITLVYGVLTFILLITFYKNIRPYIFNYVLIGLGILFIYIQGNVIGYAYFYRLIDLLFQTLLVHILIARTSTNDRLIFSFRQAFTLIVILIISIVYSHILIGGNIWRFF